MLQFCSNSKIYLISGRRSTFLNRNIIVTKKLIMYIAQHHAKRANNHKESNLVSYRLCGCTSGALIVVQQLTSLLLLKWGNQKNGHNNKIYSIYGISHGIAPREACFWMFESKKHKGDGNDQHYQANYSGSFLCHF